MNRLNKHNINLSKINLMKNFSAYYDRNTFTAMLKYRGLELDALVPGIPVISRKLGYNIPLAELEQLNILIMSAEENFQGQLYHEHYYFILKDIDHDKALVKIKYLNQPVNSNANISEKNYLSWFKSIVKDNPKYNLVGRPKYEKKNELILLTRGFAIRSTYNSGSFYFETELQCETLGDIYLGVDSIVASIENTIKNKLNSQIKSSNNKP